MAAAVAIAFVVRARHRVVPQRRRLAPAARRVARAPAVALPGLRDADQALRQHPGAVVAAAARPLPAAAGTRSRARYPLVELTTGLLYAAVVLAKDEAVDIALGLLLVTALVPIVLIDLEHRLIPNRITLPAAIAGVVAILVFDPGFIVEALIAARRGRRLLLPGRRRCTRAGWAWATSSSPACWACTWAAPWGPALFAALILGVLVGGIIIARVGARGRAQDRRPVRPVPRDRRPVRLLLRRGPGQRLPGPFLSSSRRAAPRR